MPNAGGGAVQIDVDAVERDALLDRAGDNGSSNRRPSLHLGRPAVPDGPDAGDGIAHLVRAATVAALHAPAAVSAELAFDRVPCLLDRQQRLDLLVVDAVACEQVLQIIRPQLRDRFGRRLDPIAAIDRLSLPHAPSLCFCHFASHSRIAWFRRLP